MPNVDFIDSPLDHSNPNVNSQTVAGLAAGWLSKLDDAKPEVPPAVTVHTLDGIPTAVGRAPIADPQNVGKLVSDDDLRAMGLEPLTWPQCEYPGCKESSNGNSIIAGSGKPLSINAAGELVFGKLPPLAEHGLSELDRARIAAGLPPEGSAGVGPSFIKAATIAPKHFVHVCLKHSNLPTAPQPAPEAPKMSGPYSGIASARKRANEVAARLRSDEVRVVSVKVDGSDAFYVVGDDGEKTRSLRGKLTEAPARFIVPTL